ncbi:acid membrane antigen A [Aliarcobacter faecis]|uniref:AI-2E family transporter n=1 Tax=Aliarcobacter faecis TaxID=1564138 RepID=UPI000479517F|nr:AI-2E family transporter [Aliarcobacter faecis]QKF72721.1 acid membrane antigen A [Aliarcobacter faecis]
MKPAYFLISIALVLLFFLVELFNPFLKAIIVSILLTISTNTLTLKIERNIKNRVFATTIMTLGMTALFFIPILYCIFSFATFFNQVDQALLITNLNEIKNTAHLMIMEFPFLNDFFKNIVSQIDIGKSVQQIVSISTFLGKNSAKFMIDMILILLFFFFFTLYSTQIAKFLKDLLPIKNEDSTILFNESSSVMSVVFYSILVTAIFEGFLFGVFLKFFDYDGLLFGVLYGFASLIPVIGGVIMWLPISIYELTTGSFSNALIIAIYSIVVISIIADTFIKPLIINYINKKVIKNPTKINSLLIFFAIVAGLSTFGFWGMIIGPALLSLFISIMYLLKKYSDDLK